MPHRDDSSQDTGRLKPGESAPFLVPATNTEAGNEAGTHTDAADGTRVADSAVTSELPSDPGTTAVVPAAGSGTAQADSAFATDAVPMVSALEEAAEHPRSRRRRSLYSPQHAQTRIRQNRQTAAGSGDGSGAADGADVPAGSSGARAGGGPGGGPDGRDSGSNRTGAVAGGSVLIAKKTLIVLVVLGVVAVVLGTVLVMNLAHCNSASMQGGPTDSTTTWVAPYDWTRLRNDENGLLAYYDSAGNKISEEGVDVSEHDGTIDWAAVRAGGIDFAMVRLGYRGYTQGSLVLDGQFYNNIMGAYAAGIKVGVYFFSQAITVEEAQEEAQFVIDTLKNVNVALSYPIAFDEELHPGGSDVAARTDNLTGTQLTQFAVAYLAAITAAGYDGMVYGNQHDLARLDLTGELAQYPIWYAEYGVSSPTGQFNMDVWQYTDTGPVAGINGANATSDINIRFIAPGMSDS